VARQTLYDYPGRVRKEKRRELRIKNAEVGDVNQTLTGLREKFSKHAVEERGEYEDLIASNRERIEEARHQLEILRPQLLENVRRISEARDAEGARTDYDHLVELENQGKALRGQIETHEAQIEKLEAENARARASLEEGRRRAAQVQRQIEVLEAQKESLLEERQVLRRQASWADDQHDLVSVRLRIHKRLAQAVSLLVFALLGIPLGIMAGGRSTMIAFGISFAIVLMVFYPFLVFGQIAAKAGMVPVVPAMWAGNVFVCVIGAVLMFRVLLR
jgi:lipopolysaccharide export LptBFGC system permease protein LptF